MVMYAKIRRMFFREHLSISEIQRRTSLSRNTIKKWLKEPDEAATKYRRAKASGKLTPFEPRLLLALEADAHRPKRERRTALMLFAAIQQDGFTGGYPIVTDFIRDWRNHASNHQSVSPVFSIMLSACASSPRWNCSIPWSARRPPVNRASWRSA